MKDLLWRVPLALLAGLIALYTFPTENVWILAPLIPALSILSVLGAGGVKAFLLGFITGQAFYIAHIEWISLYLGPVPLLALSTLMALYFGLGTALTAWLYRKLRLKGRNIALFAPLAAAVWTLREFVANNFPYGGFPWSRLAMTQSDSLLAAWVWWGGMSLLTFVVALLGGLLAIAAKHFKERKLPKRAMLAVFLLLLLIPVVTPKGVTTTYEGDRVIAGVQGNANAGLFSNVDQGTILQNHIDATELIFESELAGEIDLLVWPENASDIDPLRSQAARAKIDEVASRVGAPFTFGTITKRGDETFNSTLLWYPGVGPVDYYDKKQPVPFAEYAPDREFWRLFAPDLVDMIPRGFSFGQRDGLFELDDFTAGTLICFEIAEDGILRELTNTGAQVILSQTNNADFGYSDETYQQAGIARLRAIETGRAVVNISTVGVSAIFLPSGEVLSQVEWYQPAAIVESVPIYSGSTPAMFVGSIFDWLIAALVAGTSAFAFFEEAALKALVLMPTYNEVGILSNSVSHLLATAPEVDLLIIDDNSPDGTGRLADELAENNSRISVLHRPEKQGLGEAYVAGFAWGLAQDYSHFIQMDSDGSHRPEDLSELLSAAVSADLVIGSRWVAGGEVRNWPAIRMLISRLGNRYASFMLGSSVKDMTAGFRVYSRGLLEELPIKGIQAHGYGFQVEMTYQTQRLGRKIVEVPITFVERESGQSKMTLGIVLEAFWLCTLWGLGRLFRR